MINEEFYVELMESPSEVTGSFNFVSVHANGTIINFLVDCGIYQEKGYENKNSDFLVNPKEIDFAILTHNHLDHQGRFPFLVSKGFEGKIYTTKLTNYFLGDALSDNYRVHKNNAKYGDINYSEDDVSETLKRIVCCEFNETIEVNNFIKIQFIKNGHLVGAASVLVQIHCTGYDDINILFTGDYNNKNLFFRVPEPRKFLRELPLNVVTESTYGYMDSSDIRIVFRKNIIKALEEDKTIIIPVFSLGRAQEILYILKDMQEKYEVFKNIPIYFDAKLSFKYTDTYIHLLKQGELHFYKGKDEFLPTGLKRVDNCNLRRMVTNHKGPKIIVASSGMGSYGSAQNYIREYISKEKALIHFTGYCSDDSLGGKLKKAEKGEIVTVGGIHVVKRADVEFTNEFSAHAKADEIIDFLNKFHNLRAVFVNHGRKDVKDAFADRIVDEVEPIEVGVLGGDYFYRIYPDSYTESFEFDSYNS